jgi:general secretion pathway protein I
MSSRRGFTLLEILVATLLMGIAVVGLLSNISTSLRTGARLTDYDRAALLARAKMDELLLEPRLPKLSPVEGRFDAAATGGVEAGWRARASIFEAPQTAAPGMPALERIELEVWWMSGATRRKLSLEGFHRIVLAPEDAVKQ